MKTKLLLAALALPLVFTACSQDELENSRNSGDIPSNAVRGLTLSIQKSGEDDAVNVDTKGTWHDGDNKILFDETDKISLYWLGSSEEYETAAVRGSVTGKFNSVFRTDNGTDFSSESLVFLGGNIAVYPGDLTFVKEGAVYLSVPASQKETELNNIPYISDQLWINKYTDAQTEQVPGYYGDKVLDCPVKQAANVVNLKLNLSNIPAGYGFEVQSVELSSGDGEKAFTNKSKIITKNKKPNYGGEVMVGSGKKKETIVAETWSSPEESGRESALSTQNITKVNENTVIAHFVVLPTDVEEISDNAEIIVRTNCGAITLKSSDVISGSTELKNVVRKSDGSTDGDGSIKSAIEAFVQSQTASASSKFSGEEIGKTFRRQIAVNVAEAKLNNSLVYTSEDIIRYVNLHTAMKSTESVNLVLAVKSADMSPKMIFKGLTKVAVDKIKTKSNTFKLKSNLDGVEIVGGGEVFDVVDFEQVGEKEQYLYLGANENWSMDDKLVINSAFSRIDNQGTLTVRGTAEESNQNSIGTVLTNEGTIKLGGNNLVKVEKSFENKGVIDIEAEQELQFGNTGEGNVIALSGTINVNDITARLTTTANISNAGVINNSGIVAGSETAGWTNEGTINVTNDFATTYVMNNEDGTIVLRNRTDEVRVDQEGAKGKIVYTWKDGDTFEQSAADRFNYVVFNNSVLTVKGSEESLEEGTSMEFTGTLCTLTAKNIRIADLIVAKGANLRFTSGNILNVSNLTNDGVITIGGNIIYSGSYKNDGRVLTTGVGAITEKPRNSQQ